MAAAAIAANVYAAAAQKFGAPGSMAQPIGKPEEGSSFTDLLSQAMGAVTETGKAADSAAINATAGKTDMIDIVTAVAESETAMQTLVSVRDRVISAYEDIMRMPI
jgi:flagellar hook-basal body complex protein FliE